MREKSIDVGELLGQRITLVHQGEIRRVDGRCRPVPFPRLLITLLIAGERPDARVAHCPVGLRPGDAPSCPKNSVGDRQLVGRSPDVHPCIVENQVLYMDKLAPDPHAGGDIEEVTALDETLAHRASPHLLVEPGELILRPSDGRKQGLKRQVLDIVTHCSRAVLFATRKLSRFSLPS